MNNEWEYYCDAAYYDMWAVSRHSDRKLGQAIHVRTGQEAETICRIFNQRDRMHRILNAILESDERGRGLPFAEAMEAAYQEVRLAK